MHRFLSRALYGARIKSRVLPTGVTEIVDRALALSPREVVEFEADSPLVSIGSFVRYFLPCILWSCSYSTHSKYMHCFYSQVFASTHIKSRASPKGSVQCGEDVLKDTPCPDNTVFQPGTTVVDCEIVSVTPSVSRRNCERIPYSTRAVFFCPASDRQESLCASHKGSMSEHRCCHDKTRTSQDVPFKEGKI